MCISITRRIAVQNNLNTISLLSNNNIIKTVNLKTRTKPNVLHAAIFTQETALCHCRSFY